jgi:CheY-like chemotaxis protein
MGHALHNPKRPAIDNYEAGARLDLWRRIGRGRRADASNWRICNILQAARAGDVGTIPALTNPPNIAKSHEQEGNFMMGLIRAFTGLFFPNVSARLFDEHEQSETPVAQNKNTTILAIDDDPVFLDGIRELLGVAGFNVLTSTTGPKGLDMLRYAQRDIRAVLLDYSMPRFNGADTLEYVRRLSPDAKVVALTGVELDQVPESFRQGVDEFIRKPCRTAHLIEVLNSLVDSKAPVAAHVGNS